MRATAHQVVAHYPGPILAARSWQVVHRVGRELEDASVTFGESVRALAKSLSDGRDAIYARSAALFDRVDRRIEEQDVLVAVP